MDAQPVSIANVARAAAQIGAAAFETRRDFAAGFMGALEYAGSVPPAFDARSNLTPALLARVELALS